MVGHKIFMIAIPSPSTTITDCGDHIDYNNLLLFMETTLRVELKSICGTHC